MWRLVLRGRRGCVVAVALLCLGAGLRANDREELARVRAANTAAIESIRTLKCQVVFDDKSEKFGIPGGEYWRSGSNVRLHWTQNGNANQAVIRDGIVRHQMKQDISDSAVMKSLPEVRQNLEGGRYYWHGAVERFDGRSPYAFDPWANANCAFSDGGKGGSATFDQFAANHEKEFKSIRRVTDDGVTTVAVEFRLPGFTCTTHLDPAANYMVRKTRSESTSPDGYTSGSEVVRFKEAAPGVYFPEQLVIKRWKAGKAQPDDTVTFRNVVVNQPIPDSTFDLKYRNGIYLTDRIERKEYQVNENGLPIGSKRPMATATSIPIDPRAEDDTPPTETKEEPRRWGWWILPLFVTVLCVAATVVLVRRRQAAAVAGAPSG